MKLTTLALATLLLIGSASAGDWKEATVSRHGDNLVFVILPGFFSGHRYMMLCMGNYSTTRETGVDCKPALPIPEPKELQAQGWAEPGSDRRTDAIRVNLTDNMYQTK